MWNKNILKVFPHQIDLIEIYSNLNYLTSVCLKILLIFNARNNVYVLLKLFIKIKYAEYWYEAWRLKCLSVTYVAHYSLLQVKYIYIFKK